MVCQHDALVPLFRAASPDDVRREYDLVRCVACNLVTVRPLGQQKHFQANPASPIFAELCGIVQKTVGLAEPLREALAPLASRFAPPSSTAPSRSGRTRRPATST